VIGGHGVRTQQLSHHSGLLANFGLCFDVLLFISMKFCDIFSTFPVSYFDLAFYHIVAAIKDANCFLLFAQHCII
jgi:hypothetical protein